MSRLPRFSRWLWWAFLAAAFALAVLVSLFDVFELFELQTYDWRCQVRGSRPVSQDIVLVEISDDSLQKIGEWPFDRQYHAALIEVLRRAGARAVAFDMLFVDTGSSDALVANAAREARNVFFAEAFKNPRSSGGVVMADAVLAPLLPVYRQSALAVGHVNVKADADGKRRRVPLWIQSPDGPHFHLGLQLAAAVLGVGPSEIRLQPGRFLDVGGLLSVPLGRDGHAMISYAGKWEETFRHVSYADILSAYQEVIEGQPASPVLRELKDKICIVGLTAAASHDIDATPLETIYPMVGMHANVLNMMLTRDFIRRVSPLTNLLILIPAAFFILWSSFRIRPVLSLLRLFLVAFLYSAFTVFAFVRWGLWFDLFYPIFLIVAIYSGVTLRRTLFEIRRRELIEKELAVASRIQQSFLPESVPEEKEGLDVAVFFKPAKAVGGDLYAFVKPSSGHMGFMVGDVSGKGMPAALFMAKAVSEFKYAAKDQLSPGRALTALNDSVASESTGGLFVTLIYALIHTGEGTLRLSSAGHLPAIHVSARQEDHWEEISSEEGIPVGLTPGSVFSERALRLEPGDLVALYTDGVSEARNRRGQEYGVEPLRRMLVAQRGRDSKTVLEAVMDDLRQFTKGAEPHDDATLIVVKWGPVRQAEGAAGA